MLYTYITETLLKTATLFCNCRFVQSTEQPLGNIYIFLHKRTYFTLRPINTIRMV